jgi:arylsulfatase A-like enzyme
MVNFAPNADQDLPPAFPASQGSNFPLRGSKATMFEGGTRGLGFVSGGIVPKPIRNTRFSGLAHVVDISATILGRV